MIACSRGATKPTNSTLKRGLRAIVHIGSRDARCAQFARPHRLLPTLLEVLAARCQRRSDGSVNRLFMRLLLCAHCAGAALSMTPAVFAADNVDDATRNTA